MPSSTGMRMSINTTSMPPAAHGVDRLLAVGGLPDDGDVIGSAEDQREPRAHQRVVIGQHDGDAAAG